DGSGQWVSLDSELEMRDGEVFATKTPTGHNLLLDCRFELPFALRTTLMQLLGNVVTHQNILIFIASNINEVPYNIAKSGNGIFRQCSQNIGTCVGDNQPCNEKAYILIRCYMGTNSPGLGWLVHSTLYHPENTEASELQRKLELLNNTMDQETRIEQVRRQMIYNIGHCKFPHFILNTSNISTRVMSYECFEAGYSEDSDYTSDLNYPIGGQGANSSASQFRTAANQLATPQRSLETSRENSYERDEQQVPMAADTQEARAVYSGFLNCGLSAQLGDSLHAIGLSKNRLSPFNAESSEPLFYNSRPNHNTRYREEGEFIKTKKREAFALIPCMKNRDDTRGKGDYQHRRRVQARASHLYTMSTDLCHMYNKGLRTKEGQGAPALDYEIRSRKQWHQDGWHNGDHDYQELNVDGFYDDAEYYCSTTTAKRKKGMIIFKLNISLHYTSNLQNNFKY
ncbi:hypothetical protein TSAR_008055, partial [Trichomalopsis sarcophagae]